IQIFHYFFTNKMGDITEKWKNCKRQSSELFKLLPNQIKKFLRSNGFSNKEIEEVLPSIIFITGQKESFLKPYIDLKLLEKFKSFKDGQKPGTFIDILKYNMFIFREKRLKYANIEKPAFEKDILISNVLEVDLNKEIIFYAKHKKGLEKKFVEEELQKNKILIAFLMKNGNIYSFKDLNNKNPLTNYLDPTSSVNKMKFNQLEPKEQIQLLNDWLDKYLRFLGLNIFKFKRKKYYYFHYKNNNLIINWVEPKTKKIKEWKVVENRRTHYKNLAASIQFRKFDNNILLFIVPRLTFTSDGENILEQHEIRKIELKYRKNFMKNDFLRRVFHMWASFIKNDMDKEKHQTYFKPHDNVKKFPLKKRFKFSDLKILNLKEIIEFEVDFKPNNESIRQKDEFQRKL
ncbi:MAG: hypothetical protein ACTSRP_27210, partial [Candidatus Helarchaeota archaeon]